MRTTSKTDFTETFAILRGILSAYAGQLSVQVDKADQYHLASPTLTDRIGRPLSVAWVEIQKNHVSYHLMPVYMNPKLASEISPALKKRMQGKACFNFTTIEAGQAAELATLTKKGIEGFRKVDLPWKTRHGPQP